MHTRQGTRPRSVTAIFGTMLGDGKVCAPKELKEKTKLSGVESHQNM